MAGLNKRNGSPFWYLTYRDRTGRLISETTGQTDWRKANKIRVGIEEMIEEEKRKTMTIAKARDMVSRICKSATGEAPRFYSIKDWLYEYLAQEVNNLAKTTYDRYKKVVEGFLEYIGDKQELSIDSLLEKDIRQFRDKSYKEGVSADSCNMLLKILSIPITKAHRQGLISVNPIAAIKPIEKREKKERREVFSEKQARDILNAASGNNEWYGCILFGFFTGARLSDIANLRWEAIDFEKGEILLTPQKTSRHGTEVNPPIHPQLSEWLQKQPPHFSPSNYIFPSLAGRPTGGTRGLSAEFVEYMGPAGITRRIIKEGKGRGYDTYNLSFHSFRHTFTTILKEKGIHPELVMELVGHTDAATSQNYTHYGMEAKAQAIGLLPRL